MSDIGRACWGTNVSSCIWVLGMHENIKDLTISQSAFLLVFQKKRSLTLSCASPSLILVTLQGILVAAYVLGSLEQKVMVTSLAQLG